MNRWVVGAVSLVLSSAPALSADMPYRPYPPRYAPPPVISWTGFYLGVNAGYSWGVSPFITPSQNVAMLRVGPPVETQMALTSAAAAAQKLSASTNGFSGGLQVGFNWQASEGLLVGIEADAQGFANTKERATSVALLDIPDGNGMQISSFAQGSRSLNYLGTLRARVGYFVMPTLLVYGTAGLAYGGVSGDYGVTQALVNLPAVEPQALPGVVPAPFAASAWSGQARYQTNRLGWAAGLGVEWMFMPGVTLRGEYLYYSLGTQTTPVVAMQVPANPATGTAFGNVTRATTRFDGHLFRAGVNILFNESSPVAAPIVNGPVFARY